jgi:hypothetical protein
MSFDVVDSKPNVVQVRTYNIPQMLVLEQVGWSSISLLFNILTWRTKLAKLKHAIIVM